MQASVLTIGTEITRGELVNTNAAWLADELTSLGFDVVALDSVDDQMERIEAALQRLTTQTPLVICTGGLGPTTDDITALAVARQLGRPLVTDVASLAAITRRLEHFGRKMTASNAKQADLPEGATALPNALGTAPGFFVESAGRRIYCLPGVPLEMKALFTEQIAPVLRGWVSEPAHQILLCTFGMSEATLNDRLAGIEQRHDVILGYRARSPELEVKVLARGPHAATQARAAASEVRERLGNDIIFGEAGISLAEVVGNCLLERGLTLGCAESCTGGLVSSLLTLNAGASRYFQGSLVTYSDRLKHALLGVPLTLLEEQGAVSEAVARSMAEGARSALGVDVALAITGVAGPDGGTAAKPVGLVHFAVSSAQRTQVEQILFPSSRLSIQRVAAFTGLALVRRTLTHT